MDTTLTTKDKATRRNLSMLELAQEMGNVSKPSRITGYSLQQFYEIRRNYQTYGAEGLIDPLPGATGPHPNRVSEEVEAASLAHARDHPTHRAPPRSCRSRACRSPEGSSACGPVTSC